MPGNEFYRWQVRSFTVLLALDVVTRICQALRDPKLNGSEEQGGLLLGRGLGEKTIEITDFELVHSGHRRGISYDLSPHERDRLGQRVQALGCGKGPMPVGYFRTHLRPGLFLDQSDVAVMTETFIASGITLAIRMNQQGPADAGIFFPENEDIDGRQPGLKFPFDAEALRIQGPIEEGSRIGTFGIPEPRSRLLSISRKTLISAGVYTVAGAILALATITGLRDRGHRQDGQIPAALSAAPHSETVTQESQNLIAPPAVFSDGPISDDTAENPDLTASALRTPFGATSVDLPEGGKQAPASADAPPFREAPPAAERDVTTPPAPLPLPAPEPSIASTNLLAAAPAPGPAPVVTAPPVKKAVRVDVSIEPKEDGVFRRVARKVPGAVGHVPLLGRLPGLRRDRDEDVVAARPYEDLSPRIPAEVSRNLAEQVEVDVDASIDEQGEVKNTEIVRGDDPQLSALAENAVRAARWKPARSGDRNVAMSLVVHYRFNPIREP